MPPPTITPEDNPDESPQTRSRMEREIDEILQESQLPVAPPPPISLQAHRRRKTVEAVREQMRQSRAPQTMREVVLTMPLLVAIGATIVTMLLAPVSQILATMSAAIVIVALWVPGLIRLQGGNDPGPRTWRGRSYDDPKSRRGSSHRDRAS